MILYRLQVLHQFIFKCSTRSRARFSNAHLLLAIRHWHLIHMKITWNTFKNVQNKTKRTNWSNIWELKIAAHWLNADRFEFRINQVQFGHRLLKVIVRKVLFWRKSPKKFIMIQMRKHRLWMQCSALKHRYTANWVCASYVLAIFSFIVVVGIADEREFIRKLRTVDQRECDGNDEI